MPEGTGWLLDGFPATNFQAKLLEKALTGGDNMGREDSKTNLKDKEGYQDFLVSEPYQVWLKEIAGSTSGAGSAPQ